MLDSLMISIAANTLMAGWRNACAIGDSIAIAWDRWRAETRVAQPCPADAQEMTRRIVDLFANTYRCDACSAVATMSAGDRALCTDRVAPVLTAWLETHRAHAHPSASRAEIARAMAEVERAGREVHLARLALRRMRDQFEAPTREWKDAYREAAADANRLTAENIAERSRLRGLLAAILGDDRRVDAFPTLALAVAEAQQTLMRERAALSKLEPAQAKIAGPQRDQAGVGVEMSKCEIEDLRRERDEARALALAADAERRATIDGSQQRALGQPLAPPDDLTPPERAAWSAAWHNADDRIELANTIEKLRLVRLGVEAAQKVGYGFAAQLEELRHELGAAAGETALDALQVLRGTVGAREGETLTQAITRAARAGL